MEDINKHIVALPDGELYISTNGKIKLLEQDFGITIDITLYTYEAIVARVAYVHGFMGFIVFPIRSSSKDFTKDQVNYLKLVVQGKRKLRKVYLHKNLVDKLYDKVLDRHINKLIN
jgi:hypothetical protein